MVPNELKKLVCGSVNRAFSKGEAPSPEFSQYPLTASFLGCAPPPNMSLLECSGENLKGI